MTETMQGTGGKALRINLDGSIYGVFAEIGGGQEVSRWFFRVGGAAGTVAKTMSAYDMTVSDAIYGRGTRYVSRERLEAMLDHEYELLVERLREPRGATTRFFVFADTVATRSYKGDNECHGWLGMRFQHEPGAPASEVVLHVALGDASAARQQEALGVLGVNLIDAVYRARETREGVLRALLEDLTTASVEVDVADLTGPAFAEGVDQVTMAIDLVRLGLTPAVTIDSRGRQDQPSTVLRKRPLLVSRPRADGADLAAMIEAARGAFAREVPDAEHPPLAVQEHVVPAGTAGDLAGIAASLRALVGDGRAVMVTSLVEAYRLNEYIRRVSGEPLRYMLGVDAAVGLLHRNWSNAQDGGVLEGLGRMLTPGSRLYLFSMASDTLRARLRELGLDPSFCPVPDAPLVRATDLRIAGPSGRILEYLLQVGWAVPVDLPG